MLKGGGGGGGEVISTHQNDGERTNRPRASMHNTKMRLISIERAHVHADGASDSAQSRRPEEQHAAPVMKNATASVFSPAQDVRGVLLLRFDVTHE
jgi:hypothetical protein